jgi:hypothetical protein
MPRYFFDTEDGQTRSVDDKGLDLSGPWEARELVLAVIPDMVKDVPLEGDRREMVSCVKDQNGNVVYTATLSLVGKWEIEPPPRP